MQPVNETEGTGQRKISFQVLRTETRNSKQSERVLKAGVGHREGSLGNFLNVGVE